MKKRYVVLSPYGKSRCWLLLFILTCMGVTAGAQRNSLAAFTVTGKISDATGTVLPGASVLEKGTGNGTSSGPDGSFSLTVAGKNAVLVVTSVGFTSREIAVDGKSSVTIELQPVNEAMQQVVVVGYGTQKRENLIGSVSQVTAKQLENRPVTQLSNALTGQVAGVTVVQRSGQPGASAGTISVRGVGSFGAAPAALVIVDGIPGDLNNIDPNNVESISVLKDASSAAIYGARAANGVILVTTRLGRADHLQVGYNAYVGIQKPTAFPRFVDSWEYATLINEVSTTYTAEEIQKFKDGSDPDHYANADFIGGVISKDGLLTSHTLSIDNGAGNTQYNLSVGYLYQDGMVVKNNFNRFNLRMNIKTALNKKLDLTTRLSAIKSHVNEPYGPAKVNGGLLNIIGEAVRYPSRYPIRLSNGDYGPGLLQIGTPVSWLESDSYFKSNDLYLTSNLRLDYKIINGLKLSGIVAYNQTNSDNKAFQATQVINANITLSPNNLTVYNSKAVYYTVQALAEYNKRIGKHQIGALLGYSFEDNQFDESSAFRDKLPGNGLTEINVGAADNQQSTGTANEWALESVFARLNYSFLNKYLLEGVVRRDGSSRFPKTNKYSTFPSLAVGWQLGRESFIKDNLPWINELKLKASIGVLGNQNISNYPYQNTYNIGPNFNYPIGGILSSGARRTTIVDSTLHWESTRTADLGLEAAMFKSRLNLSGVYFNRYTYDILYSPATSVSRTLGFSLSQQNVGKLTNKGFEFTAGYHDKAGSFSYNVNGNLTILKNSVSDLGIGNIKQPNGLTGNGSNLFIGYPMQLYYGYLTDGLFVDANDIATYADQKSINPTVQPGDVRYRDISGPNGIPDGKVDATYDRTILGSSIPKYTFALNLGGEWKGFDFTVFMQGVSGVQNYMSGNAAFAFYNDGSIQTWQADSHWSTAHPDRYADYPRLEKTTGTASNNFYTSSFWLLNGAYLRIKNAQLGYQLPAKLAKKISMQGIRFYFSGENLATFSHFRKGWDPETGVSSSANDASMIGNMYYPLLRSFTFGVNVKF